MDQSETRESSHDKRFSKECIPKDPNTTSDSVLTFNCL